MRECTARAPSAREGTLLARIREGVLCCRVLRWARRRNMYHTACVNSYNPLWSRVLHLLLRGQRSGEDNRKPPTTCSTKYGTL